MIYGIGTDICDIRRIAQSLERHGERFAERVLAEAELATWRRRSVRWPARGNAYVATRFAVKEAFSKAIGLGMHMPMNWRACEVGNLSSGQPCIITHGALKDWCEARQLQFHVTLSDEKEYAVAFCIAEVRPLAGRA
ncbi:holo-ACP synthase [Corticibacter populi]|uniref:Holo-[acyl-carrier-protein] synthase n=1 Tax=Corticibacter populi TaxID=1550736 RepID=A0A3M6QZD6_9BURK|nr:holo-ACP synthase [Corticibacter populi]RMX08301.1 holo-ACP synthase [Corticibacter populi]RZS35583.1 holo-[acyl-carrier protein] synthase [Corticibacter populi]